MEHIYQWDLSDNRTYWSHNNHYHKEHDLSDKSLQNEQMKQVNQSQCPEPQWIRLPVLDND
jgi:hypothetical protein